MRRGPGYRLTVLLLLLFLLSRILLILGANADLYLNKSFDVVLYSEWASQIVDQGINAYSGFRIEYPPASLPFLTLPQAFLSDPADYPHRFTLLMYLVDLAGFVGVLLIAGRWGSRWGPWMWVVGPVVLGPIVYLRLDLVPVVATIWAVERMSAQRWFGVGGWLAFGAVAKVFPLFLLPLVFWKSPRRGRLLLGGVTVSGLLLLPYLGAIDELWRSVIAFHASRGIEVGSSWALALYTAAQRGYEIVVTFSSGSVNVESTVSATLKTVGQASSLVALGAATWFPARRTEKVTDLPVGMFAVLALIMVTGTVFSPQFAIWPVGAAAVALCAPVTARLGVLLGITLPVAALTHLMFAYFGEVHEVPDYFFLLLRNALLGFAGVAVLWETSITERSRRGEGRRPTGA